MVPGWLGGGTAALDVSMLDIARSVLIFLGIPLLAGYWTRRTLVRRRGIAWYEGTFLPRIGPTALLGLLYTIVLMFAMQGDRILDHPADVLRIALPLLIYFVVMFGLALLADLAAAVPVCGGGRDLVHGRREQLRAGHCGGHRDVRHRLGRGARGGGRAAHRSAGADRVGVRGPLGPPVLPGRFHLTVLSLSPT